LIEGLTARLQGGEELDLDALAAAYPDRADEIRSLLPALELLGDMRSSSLSASRSKGSALLQPAVIDGMLGDYRIIREVGRGGMGVVYEAQQISLRRKVALKVLPFASMLEPRQLQRFQNEAQAAASLHHPHIVPVYAVGSERGVHYYAMQFIDGQSLETVIRHLRQASQGPEPDRMASTSPYSGAAATEATPPLAALSTERSTRCSAYFRSVARLGHQAALAIQYAHERGIVHRDIKPANLLLDMQSNLWITDFGLARCQGDSDLTRTGDLLGTLRYMSPEQTQGIPGLIDPRSDVYGLGATLYELLTLRPAFAGNDRQQLLRQIASEDPCSLRRLNKSLPIELETIVLKTLAKRPDERYGSARELAEDLRRFLDDKPIRARRPGPVERSQRWARKHRTLVAAGLLMLLTLLTSSVTLEKLHSIREARDRQSQLRKARDDVDVMYTQVAQEWLAQQPHLELTQRKFLLTALDRYKQFAQESADDPELKLEVARAEHRVADIEHKLGRTPVAQDAYLHALPSVRRLAAEQPTLPAPTEELARCLNDYGNFCRDTEQLLEAERAYQEALQIFARLAKDQPEECKRWDALAGCSSNLGITLDALGRPKEAEKSFQHSLTILAKLSADESQNAAYRHDLALSECNLATLLRNTGQLKEAEKQYQKAINGWSKLIASYPGHPIYRQSLASGFQSCGTLLASLGRAQESEDQYRKALAIREKLVGDFPSIPVYQQSLAVSKTRLAYLLRNAGRAVEARKLCDQAQATLHELTTSYPQVAAFRFELAASSNSLGELLDGTGDSKAAETIFRSALAVTEELAARQPGVPEFAWLDSEVRKNLGQVLYEKGSVTEAGDLLRRALSIKMNLVQAYPEVPRYQTDLAWFLSLCPVQELRDPTKSTQLAQAALRQLAADPDAWLVLGAAEFRRENWHAARAALEKAAELSNRGTPPTWTLLAMSLWRIGQRDSALPWLKKAKDSVKAGEFCDPDLHMLLREADALMALDARKY
jgi:serine/threonine protein kinase/Flp pilus assembly protein TadD